MTTRSTQPGSCAQAEEISPAAQGVLVHANEATGERSARPGTEAADAKVTSDQRARTSPDPMSATDRYRLVTPYRLRL